MTLTAYDRLVAAGLRPTEADAALAQDRQLGPDLDAGAALRETPCCDKAAGHDGPCWKEDVS